jgi:gliding motility-associated-like protein
MKILPLRKSNKMKLKLASLSFILFFGISQAFSQDTIMFNYTGAVQTYDIPVCASQVTVEMAGAEGGANGPNFLQGLGSVVTGILTVPPGQTIEIWVGGAGTCGAGGGGFNGGGNGQNGLSAFTSCGGGGATDIRVMPYTLGDRIVVASGGGGEAGGNGSYNPSAGDGGCNTGSQSTQFSWGDHGFGGTQTAGGAGGTAWGGGGQGQPGSLGSGGNGAADPCFNTGPGGGGGGGYYGGGGGGSDCWGGGGSLGGGGGGGGSSLTPLGGTCTGGTNAGDGYAMIIIDGCSEPTICVGDTAQIDMTQALPPGVISYSWSPTTGVSNPSGGPIVDVYPIDSIVYTVTITTLTGSIDLTYPVHVIQPIQPNAGLDDSLCFSTALAYPLNGTLWNNGTMFWENSSSVTFGGGVGAATFNPSTTVPATAASVNLAGEYYFVLHEEDTLGVCPEGTDTVAIYFSEEAHTTTFTDPICFGYADGTIDITTDNGATSGNLGAVLYSVDNGTTFQAGNTFAGLPSGTYDIISQDYLGCQFTSQVTLTDPPAITMSLVSSDTTICQNGTATLAAIGNNAPAGSTYTYFWSASTDNTSTTSITPSPAGTDFSSTVYAQTSDGCFSDTLTLNVTHQAPISLLITANDSICPGYDADQTVTASGGFLNGNADYTYSWTENGAAMANTGSTINITPTVNTTYCATVSDGCETTPESICTDVIMRNVPQPLFTSDVTWGCVPTDVTFSNATAAIDTDSITWLINGVFYFNEDPLTITFDQVGTYDVWLEVYSEYGCFNAITAQDYITIYDTPDPMFYVNPNPTTMFNTGVDVNNVTPGLNNTYQWIMPGGLPTTSSVENPAVYYPEGIVAEYPITLIVTNEWGCVDSITALVDVVSDVIIYAPNIFTPDGDEYNETWRVYIDGIDVYDYHLTMYNRWGEPVWESFNQIAEWQGYYGDNGQIQDGTFVWLIEAKETNTDKKYEFRGHVTVLK